MLYVVVQCIPIAGNEDNSRIEIEEINIKRKYQTSHIGYCSTY